MTPADVSSKLFSRGMRGYNMEEVDTFLDEIEEELTRLLRENNDLRQRVQSAAAFAAAPAPAAETSPAVMAPGEGQEAALRTLLLAQRTADTAIAEARAEAEEMVAKARAGADSVTESSRQAAEQAVTSARADAERTRTQAQNEANDLLAAAEAKSAAVDAEVAAKVGAALNGLEERRKQLEGHIEALRAFEREYRTRLRAYLQGQLRELDSRSAPADDDVPAATVAPAAAPSLPPSSFAEFASAADDAAEVVGAGDVADTHGPAGRPSLLKPGGASFPAVEPAEPVVHSPFARPGGESGSDVPQGLRAVPPLSRQAPEVVGPFSSEPPTGPPAGAEGTDEPVHEGRRH